MGLSATYPDEGISTTKPLPEGTNTKPKDLERLKPLADRDSSTPPVTTLSGTNAEYQVDKTQSIRFEVLVPDQHQGKTSSEVEPDNETLLLITVTDIQALLEEDELQEDSVNDVFEAGEEMDEDIQEPDNEETQTYHFTETPTQQAISIKHLSPSPPKEHLESSQAQKTDASDSRSLCSKTFKSYDNYIPITERQLKHEEAAISYADLRATIEGYHEEIIDHRDQTNKLVKETMNNLDKISKEEPEFNQILLKAAKGYIQNFSRITNIADSLKAINFPSFQERITVVKSTQVTMKASISSSERMMYQLTEEEIQAHLDKEEKIEQAAKEARLSKPELIKVVHEEAAKAGVDPKILASAKGGQEFFQSPHEGKKKHQELELVIHILGLECNKSLHEGIPFVNNIVIKQLEHGIFFIDVFGDEAFQRISDIHKVDIDTLLTNLVMAFDISIQTKGLLSIEEIYWKSP
ncbi:hypothetical protein Tco_0373888 [Tanacetum coccineum]